MSTLPIGMIIESLVAILLLVTIAYCFVLNRRLQRLRADEQTLRATISELITATEIAERAILGLKGTAAEADKSLGGRLAEAEQVSRLLDEQLTEGEKILTRISQIAEAARSSQANSERAAMERAESERAERERVERDFAEQERQRYQVQPPVQAQTPTYAGYQSAPVQAQVQQPIYGVAPAVVAPRAEAPDVTRPRGISARDIREAAAEATARLERFRKRSGEAAA